MLPGDMHGLPYTGFTTPDGKYLYFSMPPPNRNELLHEIQGWVAKIDTDTWKVVQSIPMKHYPLWTAFSMDGKWAWVTNSVDDSVVKLQRATKPAEKDKVVAEIGVGTDPMGCA